MGLGAARDRVVDRGGENPITNLNMGRAKGMRSKCLTLLGLELGVYQCMSGLVHYITMSHSSTWPRCELSATSCNR